MDREAICRVNAAVECFLHQLEIEHVGRDHFTPQSYEIDPCHPHEATAEDSSSSRSRSRSPLPRLRNATCTQASSVVNVLPDAIHELLAKKLEDFKQEIFAHVKVTIPEVVASLVNAEPRVEPSAVEETSQKVWDSGAKESLAHDLQVLKTDSAILKALDNVCSKLAELGGNHRSNITATFHPMPPIVSAAALHAKVEAAGIKVLKKGEPNARMPYGEVGGQKGQPSVSITSSPSVKLTVQVHSRLVQVVLKGRRSCFTHDILRKLLPFFGPVSTLMSPTSEA